MKRKRLLLVIGLVAIVLPALPARAQVPPFFGQGMSIFDPEIGVVSSGVLNDVSATVSADRKYVTLTMRPSNAQLLSLQEFQFQGNGGRAPLGNVGGAGGGAANPAPAANVGAQPGANAAPARGANNSFRRPALLKTRAARPGVLDCPGMTLVGRIYRTPTPARPG